MSSFSDLDKKVLVKDWTDLNTSIVAIESVYGQNYQLATLLLNLNLQHQHISYTYVAGSSLSIQENSPSRKGTYFSNAQCYNKPCNSLVPCISPQNTQGSQF